MKFLVANKVDLVEDREVSAEEGKAFAEKFDMDYYETSALTGIMVKDVFEAIIEKVYKIRRLDADKISFQLNNKDKGGAKGSCC